MTGEIVVFIGGPSGVGKTSVALEVHAQLSAVEVSHCVIDGDFLDMAHPAPWEHGLTERNLSAMWANYRALGYSRLVYTNTVSVLPSVMESLVEAMGGDVEAVAVLLTCTAETARKRLRERERGSELARHIESSSQMAATLEANCPPGVHRVATDNRSVHSVAADVIRLTGWLSRQRQKDPLSPSEGLRRGGPESVQVVPADVDVEGVCELLAEAVGGDSNRVDNIVEQYRRDPTLVLLRAVLGHELIGVVGYRVRDTDVVILHIATRKDSRRSGVGRRMLDAVCEANPRHFRLSAETDSDAVGFYIANGFVAESLGAKYAGVERFHVQTLAEGGPQPENQGKI